MLHRRPRRSPLLSLLVLLAGLGAAAATPPASADIVSERVSYQYGGDPYYGWLLYDDELPTPRPAVILFHEWWGLEDFALQQAQMLAEAGYVVFCADMYGMAESGENIVTQEPEEAQRLSGRLYRDRVWMRQLATAAFVRTANQSQVDPSRIAAIGYGFGGTVALELARSGARLLGTVCIQGGLHNPRPEDASRIRGEIMVHQGIDDPMVPRAEIDAFEREMDEADKPYEVIRISGAEHAFANRRADFWGIPGASYDERAAEISEDHLLSFLERILGGPTQGTPRQTDR